MLPEPDSVDTMPFESDALAKSIYDELSRALPGITFEDQGYHEFDEFHLDEI
ncbi:MAG: hypothetical protein U0J70_03815 [Atopobiaceae bacterium]|nr:hypothetical protein [Atopobiaceae bacterium]